MAQAKRKQLPVKHAGGRPTDYKDEYDSLAFQMCLVLRATDEQLAEVFEVSIATIYNWKRDHPKFLDAIKRGKEIADARVAVSLYERAVGYSHPDVHISNYQGEITKTPIIKHYPPEPAACIFWLKNRQPGMWRDKIEHTGTVTLASLLEQQGEKDHDPS